MAEKDLGRAVIYIAYKDAISKKDSFRRRSARSFLCGINEWWLESLMVWCDVAEIDYHAILVESRRRFGCERAIKLN